MTRRLIGMMAICTSGIMIMLLGFLVPSRIVGGLMMSLGFVVALSSIGFKELEEI